MLKNTILILTAVASLTIANAHADIDFNPSGHKELKPPSQTANNPTPEPTASPNAPTPKKSVSGLLKSRVVKWTPEATEEFNDASAKEIAAIKKAIATIHWSRKADPE